MDLNISFAKPVGPYDLLWNKCVGQYCHVEISIEMEKDLFFDQLMYLINLYKPKNKLINKSWFNYKKLKTILLKSGFSSIYKSGFGQSKSPQMRNIPLFDGKNPSLSLYIESRKLNID